MNQSTKQERKEYTKPVFVLETGLDIKGSPIGRPEGLPGDPNKFLYP